MEMQFIGLYSFLKFIFLDSKSAAFFQFPWYFHIYDIERFPYDYSSITHYKAYGSAKDPSKPAMIPRVRNFFVS